MYVTKNNNIKNIDCEELIPCIFPSLHIQSQSKGLKHGHVGWPGLRYVVIDDTSK